MSMTSVSGRRHPPIAFSRHPASRCNPARSTSGTLLRRPRSHPPRQRRLRGQAPGLAQRSRARPVAGGQPQRRIVPQLRGVAVLPASLPRQQQKRPRQPPLRMPDPAPVRLSGNRFARNRTTPLRPSSSRPVRAPESPVIRSRRDPIPTGLLKLNGASIIFTSGVMAGECWRSF